MKPTSSMKRCFARRAAVLAASAVIPVVSMAGDKMTNEPATPAYSAATSASAQSSGDMTPQNNRTRMKQYSGDEERLESALPGGKNRTFYRQELQRLGYRITAVNKDTPEELEYEVVKGQNSYEVQVSFDDKGTIAKKVDVSMNLWKADSTEKALKDANYRYPYPTKVGPEAAAYSDRSHMPAWTSEKEHLQKSLLVGQPAGYYRSELRKRGYQITSVNESEPDYVEYEIVKADNSYEVQVDFDKSTGRSTKVDVTANLWEDNVTDSVLDRNEARAKR
jgi:uncharacterized protein YmfQ (DUF2313 family)